MNRALRPSSPSLGAARLSPRASRISCRRVALRARGPRAAHVAVAHRRARRLGRCRQRGDHGGDPDRGRRRGGRHVRLRSGLRLPRPTAHPRHRRWSPDRARLAGVPDPARPRRRPRHPRPRRARAGLPLAEPRRGGERGGRGARRARVDQPRGDPGGRAAHSPRADPRYRVAAGTAPRRHPARPIGPAPRSGSPDQRARDAGIRRRDRLGRLFRPGSPLRQRPVSRGRPRAAGGRRAAPRHRARSRPARRGGGPAPDASRRRDLGRRQHPRLRRAPRGDGRRGAPARRRRPDLRDRAVPPRSGQRGRQRS